MTPSGQHQPVQASAAAGQRHQPPLALHLLDTSQQELPKAHRLLHDPEHRLHRMLAQTAARPVLRQLHPLLHRLDPLRPRLLRRLRRRLRPKVVPAPPTFRPGRHQHLHAAPFQLQHLAARRAAAVRQHPIRRTQRRRNRRHVRHQLVAVARAHAHPRTQHQLTAVRVHRRLGVARLAALVAPALAHQRTVGIRQVDLLLVPRLLCRRLDRPPLARALALLPRLHLALALLTFRVRARLRPTLQLRAGLVQLRLRRLPALQLLRQTLRLRRGVRVVPLRTIQQALDLNPQPLAQLPRAVVADAVAPVRVRVHLRAVNAHRPDTQQLRFLRQRQHLRERRRDRIEAVAPKRADRVVVRVAVRRHVPNPNVPAGRALDPPRTEDAVGMAVNQQRQHRPRVALRRARAPLVHLKRVHRHTFHRLDHEVRQVVFRQPIPHVRRQQKGLRSVPLQELRHLPANPIDSEDAIVKSAPQVRQAASASFRPNHPVSEAEPACRAEAPRPRREFAPSGPHGPESASEPPTSACCCG